MACAKCNNGYILDEVLGLKVKCDCIIEGTVKEEKKILDKPVYHVTGAQKELAVVKKLIPEARKDDEYEADFIKTRVAEMCIAQKYKVIGFEKYVETLNEIILGISFGNLNKSYLIGAPNGFGKTTFANTCIKRLDAMGKKATPYISLYELGGLRVEYEREIVGALQNRAIAFSLGQENGQINDDNSIYSYKWSDYMKSDVLFTYFTGVENMKVETYLLRLILNIRGPKGLPTIVFTEYSLKLHLADQELKKYVWDDILAYKDDAASCDRLLHRSCFKKFITELQAMPGQDY